MTKRIEFIDALRGFTMILVVMHHIYGFGYTHFEYDFFSFNTFFVLFRMPLFFFISGFIFHGASQKWATPSDCTRFVAKKCRIQLIPTAVFALTFIYVMGFGGQEFLYDRSKLGYWFTIALFEFFCFYALHYLVAERLLHLPGRTKDALLVVVALCSYFVFRHSEELVGIRTAWLLSLDNLHYYVFFVFGFFVRKHYASINVLLDGKRVSTLLIVLFFLIVLPYQKGIIMQIGGGCPKTP